MKLPTIQYRKTRFINGMPEKQWYQKEYNKLGDKKYKEKYLSWMLEKKPHKVK